MDMRATTTPALPVPSTPADSGILVSSHFEKNALARRRNSGALIRIARHRYVPAPDAQRPRWKEIARIERQRAVAVGQTLLTGFAVSGVHAAILHGGTPLAFPGRVTVVGSGRTSTQRGPTYYHRLHRSLAAEDLVTVDGITCTSLPRTILECARLLPPYQALPLVDSLIRRGAEVSRWDEIGSQRRHRALVAAVDEILRREAHVRGNIHARLVLKHADGRAESPLESEGRALALTIGLPKSDLQRRYVVDGCMYFPDATFFLRTSTGNIVLHLELDGVSKYKEGVDLDDERDRQAALESLGHVVIRMSTSQVRHNGEENLRRYMRSKLPSDVWSTLSPIRAFERPLPTHM